MPKSTANHPLGEVFGFLPDDFSDKAKHYRKNKLCPYNNRVPSCTKDRANAPLGVCSINVDDTLAITCPVRFRQDWIVAAQASNFFFPQSTQWTSLTEVRIKDANGKSAGNIDVVLVAYDELGQIIDFGALEIQAVYISGNIRRPFEFYLANPEERYAMDWSKHGHYYPRPDYLASSRKRLAPQLIYKGGSLNAWNKKMTVALHSEFYKTMPQLPEVSPDKANLAWLIYDLQYDEGLKRYQLALIKTVYTQFKPALDTITMPTPGPIEDFIENLQDKLDAQLENHNPPDAPTLDEILRS